MTVFLATAAIVISIIICFLIAYQEREIKALQKNIIAAQELIKDLEKSGRDSAIKFSSFKLETAAALRLEQEDRLRDCMSLSKRIQHFETLETVAKAKARQAKHAMEEAK